MSLEMDSLIGKLDSLEKSMKDANGVMQLATLRINELTEENAFLGARMLKCWFCYRESKTVAENKYHMGECTKHPLHPDYHPYELPVTA